MRAARGLAAATLCAVLAACGSGPEERPEGAPADDSFLTGEGERPPATVATGLDPQHVGTGPLATHWEALLARQLQTTKGNTYRLREFHRGETLSLSILGVAGTMPASKEARTEVLLVVEGNRAVVEMAGKRYRLSAGSVAVFPPGTRGQLSAPRDDPLIGLLITTSQPCPAGTRPYLTSFDSLWSEGAFRSHTTIPPKLVRGPDGRDRPLEQGPTEKRSPNRDHRERLLTIPGLLSLDAHTIYMSLPPQRHAQEELVFFLQGEGSFGLDTTGNLVRGGSLLLAPPQTPHFFQNGKQQGSRCLVLHVPDQEIADIEWIVGHPEHEVPAELNYPGHQPADADSSTDDRN